MCIEYWLNKRMMICTWCRNRKKKITNRSCKYRKLVSLYMLNPGSIFWIRITCQVIIWWRIVMRGPSISILRRIRMQCLFRSRRPAVLLSYHCLPKLNCWRRNYGRHALILSLLLWMCYSFCWLAVLCLLTRMK